ncbi:TIGR03751 family conjugal transfer lipoprotein [Pasteurella skyensis]|uniref:TIGR03751 family conjugal transfer lipoprotein n=1 Tax=Phocoenobacter skyensis TaxID=97481 RepID=UPI00274E159C|nr:TIGR03751 family conjugal transfer lipoprotein [Pasteurella skyensis]MDP8189067.1 TIGR03751 family conjugal transfer lipoprotein [Pasteurella skyensis]
MKLYNLLFIVPITLGVLTGCATSQKELLPTGNESMMDVWRKNGSNSQSAIIESRHSLQPIRSINKPCNEKSEIEHYTRTAENEVTNLFPRLPNPNLVMFVFPHLSSTAEAVPIPGYTTVFPFYARVQYAQPGERTRNY